jgi:hypothetical protein
MKEASQTDRYNVFVCVPSCLTERQSDIRPPLRELVQTDTHEVTDNIYDL